jgi:hypothetical protein
MLSSFPESAVMRYLLPYLTPVFDEKGKAVMRVPRPRLRMRFLRDVNRSKQNTKQRDHNEGF